VIETIGEDRIGEKRIEGLEKRGKKEEDREDKRV
jgi:hypothetical protein